MLVVIYGLNFRKMPKNLMELINTDNGFTKYIGISVFTNLLLKKIKKNVSDHNSNKDLSLKLVKVCLKGMEGEPDPNLFNFKIITILPQIYYSISKIIDDNVSDEKRRVTRIQDYLKRVEEEFCSLKNGSNELNNEIWKFIKKLP